MAKQQPESKLVNQIRDRLKTTYPSSLWIKIHGGPYQESGIPDLLGCVHGYFIGLEVKVPEREDTLTKKQKHKLQEIANAEGGAAVVISPEAAVDIVKSILQYKKMWALNDQE